MRKYQEQMQQEEAMSGRSQGPEVIASPMRRQSSVEKGCLPECCSGKDYPEVVDSGEYICKTPTSAEHSQGFGTPQTESPGR